MGTRLDDWPERLRDVLATADRPFVWGEWDCCLFAATAVKAMTGEDFAAGFEYTDKVSALRLLKDNGGVAGIASKFLAEKSVALASRGDVVESDDALGICDGQWAFFLTETGLTKRATLDCVRAWAV